MNLASRNVLTINILMRLLKNNKDSNVNKIAGQDNSIKTHAGEKSINISSMCFCYFYRI